MATILVEDQQTHLLRLSESMRQSHFEQQLPLAGTSDQVLLQADEFILEFADGKKYVAVNHSQGYQLLRQL